MVFGLGGRGGGAGVGSNPQLEMATAELDMITDTFNKLVSSCHGKCIQPRYAEGDLTKAEANCIDRCVAKFFVVNQKVGEKMQAMGTAAAQQNAALGR